MAMVSSSASVTSPGTSSHGALPNATSRQVILALLLVSCLPSTSASFVASSDYYLARHPRNHIDAKKSITQPIATGNLFNQHSLMPLNASVGGNIALKSGAFSSFLSSLISHSRNHKKILLLLFAATILFAKRSNPQAILWPGTEIEDKETPLPEGSYGCPFLGHNIFGGTNAYGPFAGMAKLSKKFDNVFKFYSFGMPMVSVTGVENIKSLLKNEFKSDGLNTYMMGKQNFGPIFGEEALLYEPNAEKHGMLRRLVGSAMTPSAIGAAIPSIQEAASDQIEKMLEGDQVVKMEKVFSDYTLDIAWRQILGLDLKKEEVPKFRSAVEDWTGGLFNPLLLLPFRVPGLMKFTKIGRARTYLVSRVEDKLDKLEKDGPDNSTLSKLYFATDDSDGKTRLTRTQVIHNAFLLIFAGTETSASTLTCMSLILALHPGVWQKIKDEQSQIISEYGEVLTQKSLEKCTYLECVIKETLRLKPLEVGELRKIEETVIVDGKQIPKGWFATANIKQTHLTDDVVYEEDGSHMDIKKGFKPERWLDESTKPGAWLPFGDGRRRCIGEKLAMAEMKVFLSMLARKVDYQLVNGSDDIAWTTNTAMARPLDGVEVKAYATSA